MAKIHRSRRRDDNEPDIVRALEQVGCSVTLLDADSAPGVPDLLVGRNGRTYLLEVKAPLGPRGGRGGVLTPDQVTWWQGWRGMKAVVVRDPVSALEAIGAIAVRP